METKLEIIPDKITTALIQENITDQVIQKLKADYLGLKLADLNDTEGLQKISTARKECKRIRIIAEKICKAGRESAIQEQKLWIAREKQVTSEILMVENHLAAEEEKPVKEKERLRIEQEQKEIELFSVRKILLADNGMQFNFSANTFILNDISISLIELKNISDSQFDEFLSTVKTENEKVRQAAKEAADLAFAGAQALAKQKAEQDERQKQIESIEREQQEEANRLRDAKIKIRENLLQSIGMSEDFRGDNFTCNSIKISIADILSFTDERFNLELEQLKGRIGALNIQMKKQHEDNLEAAKLKAVADAELAKDNEEKERLRVASLAPDKDKLKILSQGLFDFPLPDVQSPEAKLIIKKVNDELAILIEHIDIAISNLK